MTVLRHQEKTISGTTSWQVCIQWEISQFGESMVHDVLSENTRNNLIDRMVKAYGSEGLGSVAWLARLGEKMQPAR